MLPQPERVISSFQAKRAGFLHGDQQLLIKHGVRGVWGQVQAVEAGVSPGRDTSRVSGTHSPETRVFDQCYRQQLTLATGDRNQIKSPAQNKTEELRKKLSQTPNISSRFLGLLGQ